MKKRILILLFVMLPVFLYSCNQSKDKTSPTKTDTGKTGTNKSGKTDTNNPGERNANLQRNELTSKAGPADTIHKTITHLKDEFRDKITVRIRLKDSTPDSNEKDSTFILGAGEVYDVTDRFYLKTVSIRKNLDTFVVMNLNDVLMSYGDSIHRYFHVKDTTEIRYTVGSDNFIRLMDLKDAQ